MHNVIINALQKMKKEAAKAKDEEADAVALEVKLMAEQRKLPELPDLG